MILEIIGNAFLYNTSLTEMHSGGEEGMGETFGMKHRGWFWAGMVRPYRHIFSTIMFYTLSSTRYPIAVSLKYELLVILSRPGKLSGGLSP